MKRKLDALLALTAQDARLRALHEKLERLQAQLRQLEGTLAAEQRALDEERRKLEELKRLGRERSAEVDDLDAQLRKYQRQLDEGLLSFKEMEALREKIASGRRRMERLEEEAIELLERAEQQEATLKTQEASFAQWKARLEGEIAELRREIEHQQRVLEQERAKRDRLLKEVEPGLLERYRRLSADYDDPVVPVRDGRCTGCTLQLSEITLERVREGREVTTCESCGRILYAA